MKKHKLEIFYSIQNGGDGSAYPKLMSSMALANHDQKYMDEGWAECCTGSIIVEADSPMSCKTYMENPIDYYISNEEYGWYNNNRNEFLEEFFPTGLPKIQVVHVCEHERLTADGKIDRSYSTYQFKVDGEELGELHYFYGDWDEKTKIRTHTRLTYQNLRDIEDKYNRCK